VSDYGDFCREQRAAKQKTRAARGRENVRFEQEMLALGAIPTPLPGGWRFSFADGTAIDFWGSSGKWTVVGSNKYSASPNKMLERAKQCRLPEPAPPEPKWVGKPTGPNDPPWEK
jgi:hypothetical protein